MAVAPIIMIGMAVAAAAVSAAASARAGQAQNQAAKYNAQVADMNAKAARDAAEIEADNVYRMGERTQGTLRNRVSAMGILMDTGSPLELFADNAENIEKEAYAARYRGELAATGFQQRATLDRYQGRQAQTGGYFTAGATLLGGASRAMSSSGVSFAT